MKDNLNEKYNILLEYLKSLKSVTVAFSGGVDSTFLLYAANEALGANVIAVTAESFSFPKREIDEADSYCKSLGVKHVNVKTSEINNEEYASNPQNRCYICKKIIFSNILDVASKYKMSCVCEGTNLDDEGDFRPGMQAIKELGIKSPLRECRFTKQEIRDLSKKFNLPTWDKQSFACLATRIPYGDRITEQKLVMVEKAEQLLLDMGFHQLRVRLHGDLARIEIMPEEFEKIMHPETREKVYRCFKDYGFSYISLDLMGYRTGSMNENIKKTC